MTFKRNIKLFCFLLWSLLIRTSGISQSLEWVVQIGGTNSDGTKDILIDKNGDLLICGFFSSTTDFDPGPATQNFTAIGATLDGFVCKMDTSGQLIFAKTFGSTGTETIYSVDVDSQNNIIITGIFGSTLDADPGPGVYNLVSAGNSDCFIVKLDPSGNFIWAVKLGSSGSDYGLEVKVGANDDIFIGGQFINTVDFDPGTGTYNLSTVNKAPFLLQLSSNGAFVRAGHISTNSASGGEVACIAIEDNGNIIVSGLITGTPDFDFGTGIYNLSNPALSTYFARYDSNFSLQMAKLMNNVGGVSGNLSSMETDADGNIFIGGQINSAAADIDPGPAVTLLPYAGLYDLYFAKYDNNGNLIWAHSVGTNSNEKLLDLRIDEYGNLHITGTTQNHTDFDPGPGTTTIIGGNAIVAKYSRYGELKYAFGFGSVNVDSYGIEIDDNGGIYVSGSFSFSRDFDPETTVYTLSSNSNSADIFLGKYERCIPILNNPEIVAPTVFCPNEILQVYTGYANGIDQLNWFFPSDWVGNASDSVLNLTTGYNSGYIYVQGVNACSFSQLDSVFIDIYDTLPMVVKTDFICSGDSILLLAGNYVTSGVYFDSLQGQFGCDSIVKRVVFDVPNPTLQIMAPDSICTSDVSLITVTGAESYFWNGPCGLFWNSDSILLMGSLLEICNGSYMVTGIDSNGCKSQDTVFIVPVIAPEVDAGINKSICSGESLLLNANADYPFYWVSNESLSDTTVLNPMVLPDSMETYYIISTNQGCSVMDSVTVTVHALPIVELVIPFSDSLCTYDGLQTLSGGIPLGGIYSGSGITGGNFDPFWAGHGLHAITYTYTDSNQCENSDTADIFVDYCLSMVENDISFEIFPNPVMDKLEISGREIIVSIEIHSLDGKLISTFNPAVRRITVDCHLYPSGIYTIRIQSGNQMFVSKFLKY